MNLFRYVILALVPIVAFAGCKGDQESESLLEIEDMPDQSISDVDEDDGSVSDAEESQAESLSDPKESIAYQLELLKAGDLEKLKACFTERQRDGITADAVEQGQQETAGNAIDDLVASVDLSEYGGQKTATIKMGNGRTLTTLIEVDGKWLSDTIWFR